MQSAYAGDPHRTEIERCKICSVSTRVSFLTRPLYCLIKITPTKTDPGVILCNLKICELSKSALEQYTHPPLENII